MRARGSEDITPPAYDDSRGSTGLAGARLGTPGSRGNAMES
jgi:hypothetical protein